MAARVKERMLILLAVARVRRVPTVNHGPATIPEGEAKALSHLIHAGMPLIGHRGIVLPLPATQSRKGSVKAAQRIAIHEEIDRSVDGI